MAIEFGIESMDGNFRCMNLMQRYGLQYFDMMEGIEFAKDLYQRGVITKDDTEGIEFEPGFESTRDLIEKIVFRKGIGDVLAGGIPGILNTFGKECEQYAFQAKGMADSGDPRVTKLGTMQFDRLVNPMGTRGKGGMINPGKFDPGASLETFRKFGEIAAIPKEAMDRIQDTPMKINIGRLTRYTQDYYAVMNSLSLCIRAHMNWLWPMSRMADIYSAATGVEISASQLLTAGERVWNMMKMLNVREGFSRKDDKWPFAWLHPLKDKEKELLLTDHFETKALTAEDFERLLDDYYDERGWEVKEGIPTKEKLIELGLEKCVVDLGKAS